MPSVGYFEWEKRDGAKVPHFLHGDGVLAMAGFYELWPNPDLPAEDPAKWMWSTVVITTTATDAHGHIHDRSPVILPPKFQDHWLDPALTDKDHVDALLASIPERHLYAYEVSTEVNSPRNNTFRDVCQLWPGVDNFQIVIEEGDQQHSLGTIIPTELWFSGSNRFSITPHFHYLM